MLVLEIAWIIIGIVCVVAGIRSAIIDGGYRFLIFFLMALVAFLFAWFRHTQRKKQ
jgi:hypothetical protein